MRVAGLWRHPVKSLQGEPLSRTLLEPDGVRGDRLWGVRDLATGRILTGRRCPELLAAAAGYDGDVPVLGLPGGASVTGPGPLTDAALSEWLGRPVSLVAAAGRAGRAEFFADATDDASEAIEWTMPEGRFVDAAPVLLLTTASLRTGMRLHRDGDWAPRRFRMNVLVDVPEEPAGDQDRPEDRPVDWLEDAWLGREVRLGDAVLVPSSACTRCTMVTRPQPGLEHDVEIFRTLARHHRGQLGVWCEVAKQGWVAVGDPVEVAPAPSPG